MRNPVKRHMHKSVQASVEPDKKHLKQSDAILRDADQIVSEGLFYSETMDIDGDLQGCLNDIGCSSIEIDCEEGGNEQ